MKKDTRVTGAPKNIAGQAGAGKAGKRKKKLKRFDDVAIKSSDPRDKWWYVVAYQSRLHVHPHDFLCCPVASAGRVDGGLAAPFP